MTVGPLRPVLSWIWDIFSAMAIRGLSTAWKRKRESSLRNQPQSRLWDGFPPQRCRLRLHFIAYRQWLEWTGHRSRVENCSVRFYFTPEKLIHDRNNYKPMLNKTVNFRKAGNFHSFSDTLIPSKLEPCQILAHIQREDKAHPKAIGLKKPPFWHFREDGHTKAIELADPLPTLYHPGYWTSSVFPGRWGWLASFGTQFNKGLGITSWTSIACPVSEEWSTCPSILLRHEL